ncbi:MAG TPA: phosphate ABC transporter ATP-binding protein [Longimicrobiales bacterium]
MAESSARIATQALNAGFGESRVLHEITLDVIDREILALIGPSGCGKTTLLRCLNRMHETNAVAWVDGVVQLDGRDIYHDDVDPVVVRRHIGMVLQRPTPFPTMSIRNNVTAGLKVLRSAERANRDDDVESALRRAALWDEVKDRLDESAMALSGGQQQRLCIARALAMDPHVLLFDEPTAALDPIATEKIEDLLHNLRGEISVVIVTHNMQQAARVSDRTAFMLSGELVEVAPSKVLFTNPHDDRTEAYITGRFG